MFIYSVRASTVKFFAAMLTGIVALVALIVFLPPAEEVSPAKTVAAEGGVKYDGVKTNEDRINFLSQFGWTVEGQPCEEQTVTIPTEFDSVFTGYNEIQKRQGLDLSPYAGKEAQKFVYVVTNYDGWDGLVYATVFIRDDTVIAGDVASADVSGFLHGLGKQ